MRCTANLHLRAEEDSTHRPSEYDFVGRIIAALEVAVCQGTKCLNRNAFLACVCNMLALSNAAHCEPPLCVEELRVECRIVPVRAELQLVNILLGDGQIIVVARLIDQSKDSIGDSNGI